MNLKGESRVTKVGSSSKFHGTNYKQGGFRVNCKQLAIDALHCVKVAVTKCLIVYCVGSKVSAGTRCNPKRSGEKVVVVCDITLPLPYHSKARDD
jgi:hypothetical protein